MMIADANRRRVRPALSLLLGALLSAAAAAEPGAVPAFAPLSCNANLSSADCLSTTLSGLLAASPPGGGAVTIPCGTCARFDVEDGSALTFPRGLNVEGRLLVDASANGVLNATHVVVQGVLSVREPAGGGSFAINLYGTEGVAFAPHAENSAACGEGGGGACDLGKKPLAVLGGRLDVDALPASPSCPSWASLRSRASSSPPLPDDLVPDPPQVQGVASAGERYASLTDLVAHVGGGEYKLEGAAVTRSSGVRLRLKPKGSLERANAIGRTLTLSWSYMVDDGGAGSGWTGRAFMRWATYSRPKGTMWIDGGACETTAAPGSWASCSATFTYTSGIAGWEWNDINLVFAAGDGPGPYTLRFRDIRMENLDAVLEAPDVLEVGTEAAGCWRVGDDILVTPAGNAPGGHVLREVAAIDPDAGLVRLNEGISPLDNLLLSQDEGQDGRDFAVEVASLSRKVKFTASADDADNPLHGGHLIILHTPGVPQLLRGVEISNFGQQGVIGRYPIHIHVSEDVLGTRIEKNVIRQSNQRCVVIHGSHNATIHDNVAFDVIGHCFMLENGGEWHNTFDRNLACKNSRHQVEAQWTRSDIAEPALFLISNPQNTYTNNVAAGSVAHGFWFELLPHVLGESALLAINAGVVPRHLGLIPGGFAGNVAHSCSQDGITSQGNAYQFQTRWISSDVSVFENIKSYKNTKDGAMMNAQNVHIKGSIFADNDRCINYPLKTMAGSGNVVEDSKCTAVSQHQKGRGVICYDQYPLSNPEPGFAGITFHVNKGDNAGEMFRNVSFTGFDNLSTCWDGKGTAIQVLGPNVKDDKRWTGPASLGGGLTYDGPAFDIKCSMLDWSKIDSNHDKAYQNVYVNDKDGSTGSAAVGVPKGSGAFFATPDRDPDGSAFIDLSACTFINYPDSCGMYCEGPCMRRIGVENDPYRKDVLMVISNNSTTHSYERNPNSIHYPRWKPDYEAILPKPMSGMKYSISFINAITQEPDFPSYAKLVFGGEPTCSSHVTEDEVEIIMPAINNRCQSMSVNGDFQTGTAEGWHFSYFGRDILQDANSTNYYVRTKDRRLTRSNVNTHIDFSCMKKGERYQISSKMRIANEVNGTFLEKGCSSINADCPTVSLLFLDSDDPLAAIKAYSIIQDGFEIVGDGTWANFSAQFDLVDDIPSDAYQAIVMFRLPAKIYSSILLDDFEMAHVGPFSLVG